MKKNNCVHLIGYYTNLYNYGKTVNYYELYNHLKDFDLNLKKDFEFFKYCPFCGIEIDNVNIVSRLFIDLNEYNSRRLF